MTILSVKELWYYIVNQLSTVSFLDIVDIVLVTVIFFYAIRFMRARRAGKLALGIVLLTAMLVLSEVLGLSSLNFILRNFFQLGFIARTPRGRVILKGGYEHLGYTPTAAQSEQITLFDKKNGES